MARSAPTYNSGTIPVAGSGNIDALMAVIEAQLTAHQSNGEDAWEVADTIGTGASYEKVFHSVGDRALGSGANKGDTDIWIRIYLSGGDDVVMRAYQDWSPTSHTGYREAGSGVFSVGVSDTQAIDWWCIGNEYEFCFIMLQGGGWDAFWIGQPIRPYSDALNGVARVISQSGTGTSVIIGVDRDITGSIEVGQYVWLVNQTPDTTSLQSVGVDLVEVTAKAAGSLTVDGVTNTYAVGSLIGIDPVANCMKATLASASGAYFVSAADGTYDTVTTHQASVVNPGASALGSEADFDPGVDQLYIGFQPFFVMSSSPRAFRGKIQHIRIFTSGTQSDLDIMQVDFDSGQQWKAFVSNTMFIGWVTSIGPGAS